MAQPRYSEPCLYRKKLIELWNRELQLLSIIVPTFLLLAPCSSVVYVLSYVSGLCVLQLGMGNVELLVPQPKCCWCSPASFLWVLNSVVQNVLFPWNSNTGGGRRWFIYFMCMNRSVPISFDANIEPHKIASGSVKHINVCDHCMFVFDWSWIWCGLCPICLDYTLMTYKLLGIVKSL